MNYKEILKGIVNIINTTENSDIGFTNICTYVNKNCPEEFTENKDERIRKALIKSFEIYGLRALIIPGFSAEDVISWLEKQGEYTNFISKIQVGDKVTRNEDGVLVNLSQLNKVGKHAGKIESKFHEDDWVFIEEIEGYKRGPFQIKSVDEFGYNFDEYHIIPLMYEELLSKWTIQDAKNGDVLRIRNLTFIFKEITNNNACHKDAVVAYCSYEDNNDGFGVCGPDCITDLEIITPATKEQCDAFFAKMREANYKWNNEKKELYKVELSEEDKEILEALNDYVKNLDLLFSEIKIGDKDISSKEFREKVQHWLKSIKDRVHPQNNVFDEEPAQANKEWGKDDITRINEIIETLNIVQANRVRTQRMHYSIATIDKNIDWLKSL